MADVMLRGVPSSAVEALKAEAAARELTPGELVARMLRLLHELDRAMTSDDVRAAFRRAEL